MRKNLTSILAATSLLLTSACSQKIENNIGTKEKPIIVEFVKIPKGKDTDAFYIQTTETTVEQYNRYYDEEKKEKTLGYRIANNWETKPTYPASAITFKQAEDYCKWLSKKLNKKVSLPTRDQYEEATFTDKDTTINPKEINASSKGEIPYTHIYVSRGAGIKPVKSSTPNEKGIYDLEKNVLEICYLHTNNPEKGIFGKINDEITKKEDYYIRIRGTGSEEAANIGFRPVIKD